MAKAKMSGVLEMMLLYLCITCNLAGCGGGSQQEPAPQESSVPQEVVSPPATEVSPPVSQETPSPIPIFIVKYFPVKGDRVDISVTGDWGETLELTRNKVNQQTQDLIAALQEGSRYHGYKNQAAKPSLTYRIVGEAEFLEPLPTLVQQTGTLPLTNYMAIAERINIRQLVEEKGVKEIWLYGYEGGKVRLWESNMSSPSGDISNSNRDPTDLPILSKTYTVYHYNYQRGLSEAWEDHMHQLESLLNWIDGRDRTSSDQWGNLLFWGRFVGSDISHKIINPGAGWAHYPPNAERDYDWANPRFVATDIEDWKPDGSGTKQSMNCNKWGCSSTGWFLYWSQNLPGASNNLIYQGKVLTNWWSFVSDFDAAMKKGLLLTGNTASGN